MAHGKWIYEQAPKLHPLKVEDLLEVSQQSRGFRVGFGFKLPGLVCFMFWVCRVRFGVCFGIWGFVFGFNGLGFVLQYGFRVY